MYYNIYEVDTSPIQNSMMDAVSIGDHSVFISKCAVVDELEDKERTITLQDFGKWLKKEELGTLKKTVFTLNADVSCGKHLADRYAGFHQLAQTLAVMTEDEYLHCFRESRNLVSDLMKAIDDDDDDYVLLAGSLLTMDEFLRQAIAGKSYYIGNICKYHR